MLKLKSWLFKFIYILILSALMCISASAKTSLPENIGSPQVVTGTGTIEVGFSPRGGITEMIIKEINGAQKSIEVQAYSFTSLPVAKALVNAYRRGVEVKAVLDKSQETTKYSTASLLTLAGIPVNIDRAFAIAHSKIIIVDRINVITGSFNFSKAAEESNAENCLIIRGNQELANLYETNFQWRWNETESYLR